MQFLKNTLVSLATGFVLFFFSERLFWTAFKPGDSVPDLFITWLAYSVIAYLFLALVHAFRVRSAYAMFLAGAAFGWVTEGTLVGTLYGTESSAPFPVSLLVTGVSWHALISVWVGWHFLRRSLVDERPWKTAAWAAALGLFWGTWATFLWKETPPIVVSVGAFAAHAFAITALLGGSYWVIGRVGPTRFRPRPFGLVVAMILVGIFYAEQVKKLGARPLIVLPALLAVIVVALWPGRLDSLADDAREAPLRPRNFACLLAMPGAATVLYAALLRADWWGRVPVPVVIFYGITAPIAAIVLLWSLAMAVKRWPAAFRRSATPAAGA